MEVSSNPSPPRRSPAAAALLPVFIAHRGRDLASILAALDQGDFETVARLGHNMRGNGNSYGFPEISAIGKELEAAAKARDEESIRDQMAMLEVWIEQHGVVTAGGEHV